MILLDTCCLLWLAADPARISEPARQALSENRGQLFVSAISAFEVGVKHAKGKLELPLPADQWYERAVDFHGLIEVPVNGRIATTSTLLPKLHGDPCDRMIVATARSHGMTIVTPDPLIRAYEVSVLW